MSSLLLKTFLSLLLTISLCGCLSPTQANIMSGFLDDLSTAQFASSGTPFGQAMAAQRGVYIQQPNYTAEVERINAQAREEQRHRELIRAIRPPNYRF